MFKLPLNYVINLMKASFADYIDVLVTFYRFADKNKFRGKQIGVYFLILLRYHLVIKEVWVILLYFI